MTDRYKYDLPPAQSVMLIEPCGIRVTDLNGNVVWQESWVDCDSDSSRRRVEEAIYDHPEMIDSDAPAIFMRWPRRLPAPSAEIDDEDDALTLASAVFGPDAGSPLITRVGEVSIITLLPMGLVAFLQRTFPGVAPADAGAPMLGRLSRSVGRGKRVYLHMRPGGVDMPAFSSDGLLSFVTKEASGVADVLYYTIALCESIGFSNDSDEIHVSGRKEERTALAAELRRYFNYVVLTRMPADTADADPEISQILAAYK